MSLLSRRHPQKGRRGLLHLPRRGWMQPAAQPARPRVGGLSVRAADAAGKKLNTVSHIWSFIGHAAVVITPGFVRIVSGAEAGVRE